MKKNFYFVFLITFSLGLDAQSFLQVPVQGAQGDEWIIVNYVDWETLEFKDYNCGTKSYDGHQGTDFVLRSFPAMDDSVGVYAAAAGTVTYAIDSLFDRETAGDVSKKLGNYIALSHSNDFYSYYGHLMQNSIQVEVGDQVEVGELIGFIGSSGNSTDPHLHFELWYDSLFVVDPFAGPCGNTANRFISPPAYDTSLTIWESGMHLTDDLTINDLRERITTLEEPYIIAPNSDSLLYFWSHLYGLRKDKELSAKWYTPDNEEWFEYSTILDRDYWYYYYLSFINHENLALGGWTVKLFYDGTEIRSEAFEVNTLVSTTTTIHNETTPCQAYENWSFRQLISSVDFDLQLFNANGQIILNRDVDQLPTGIYFIQIRKENEYCTLKRWLD